MTAASAAPGRNAAPRPLPDGWRWARLGDVLDNIQPGFACGQRDDAGVVQVRMNNVLTNGNFKWDDLVRIPPGHTDMTRYWLVPGDVLFNNTNSAELVGKSAIFQGYPESVVYSNHFSRLRPVSDVMSSEFLVHWMVHKWNEGFFAGICDRWVGQAAVSRAKLVELEIPLPPLPEQRRIASMLNEQMAMVEQARRAAEEMLETVAALKNAFLREIFALGKNLARGWRWVELGNICRIDRHIAESGSKEAQSLIYYSLEHIESQTGRMCKDDTDDIDGLGSSATFQFDDCHVLYGKLRPYLNKVAVPQSPGRCTVELIPLLPADSVDRYFLAWLLRRPETIDFAMQNRTGSRMPRADMNSLLTLKVPLPPLSEQRRIVALLNRRMALAEELRAAAQARLDAVQALPGTLLRLGLAGEL